MIQRFSSRRNKLDSSFLTPRLRGARSYDRIAGYFSSSILEVAGEALDSVTGRIRIVCNSQLDVEDVKTARAADLAQRQEWFSTRPETYAEAAQGRFARLHAFLRSGKLEVKVLPEALFGLAHGKAGVIEQADGSKTSFLGSVNETRSGWRLNYELLWEDSSPEAIQWVEEEFLALWNHPSAVKLSEFVIEDIERLSRRTVITSLESWRMAENPDAAAIVEAPVFRREAGLWAHQKQFVKLASEAHRTPAGARFVLADMVGLGKTIQLAMAAQLMALHGSRPILVIPPKTLVWQWQDELRTLLDAPSAVWNGKQWVDENGLEYPAVGPAGVLRCPRRIGIVSQGLVTAGSEAAAHLEQLEYECVIADEAHRARRRNLGPMHEGEAPEWNKLLAFLHRVARRSHSVLLATATPVQIDPIEAWDLLSVLAEGREHVLGNQWSRWRNNPREALGLVMGQRVLSADDPSEAWLWMKNPLPPADEHPVFENLRRDTRIDNAVAPLVSFDELRRPDQQRVERLAPAFARHHNPFLRHIVRRRRDFLEQTIDPVTNEPFLKPIPVELLGDGPGDAIPLPAYLADAYAQAEAFCALLGQRVRGAGFLKTLLLRRVGSSIAAGRITAEKMLGTWQDIDELDQEDDESENERASHEASRTLTPPERAALESFLARLDASPEKDPKFNVVLRLLRDEGWMARGCIIFSQYYDTAHWLGTQLMAVFPNTVIGLYAGGNRSGLWRGGEFQATPREELKAMVRSGALRLVLGTDAASEGLNLQRLSTLINVDLPWNPTRLEQRKGRIQRIGQLADKVYVYNMRYTPSVEDRVHQLLSDRLRDIHSLFGQLPDVLEDVWVQVAEGDIEKARRTIDAIPPVHPFELRWHSVEHVDWESCAQVLDSAVRRKHLVNGWSK
jgi:hypothetical protein